MLGKHDLHMAPNSKSKYQLLKQEDDETSSEKTTSYQLPLGKSALFLLLTVLAAFILLLLFFITNPPSAQCPAIKEREHDYRTCGKNPRRARELGCIFDPMLNAWTFPECYDDELTQEFLKFRDWKYYKDENATIPISAEEFSEAGSCWGTWEYHVAHCMFAFRKLHKALSSGKKIEMEVISQAHTQHCLTVTNFTLSLLSDAQAKGETFSLQSMGTVLHTGYYACVEAINVLPFPGVVLGDL